VSEVHEAAAGRRANKRASAFRTIGEVAEDLDLPAHVLRFWESKFPQLKPLKRGGGRRYYRPEDIALLRRIRQCLYQDGYTIRGVQKLLREGGLGEPGASPPSEPEEAASLFPLEPIPAPPPRPRRVTSPPKVVEPTAPTIDRATLEEAREDLIAVRALLDQLRGAP
jgi:DNA-binding transcriptional MerR regulator